MQRPLSQSPNRNALPMNISYQAAWCMADPILTGEREAANCANSRTATPDSNEVTKR
jgi:hypothetical protein